MTEYLYYYILNVVFKIINEKNINISDLSQQKMSNEKYELP